MKNIKFLALVMMVFFMGCNSNNGTGTLSVRLTDAPATYDEVLIDLQELKINVSNDSEEEGGWQTLDLKTKGQIDLLLLTDGKDILLTEEELPVGKISQMRMVLGSNNQIVVDGVTHDLSTPSAQQSGLKFKINATIEEDETYRMWIDFDAEKSIVESGNGKYSLKPTIKVITEKQE